MVASDQLLVAWAILCVGIVTVCACLPSSHGGQAAVETSPNGARSCSHRARGPISVDWSDIRVICLAPNYKKYDLHAVSVMGANIELWRYRLFANSCLYLEEVYRKSIHTAPASDDEYAKNPVMVAAGKKAALTRLTGSYTFDQHLEGKPEHVRELAQNVREFITGLDTAIQEVPKKFYIAYKISQNIACLWIGNKEIAIYLKLDPKEITPPLPIVRDVSEIGHVGTGDTEVSIESEVDLQTAKPLIEKAYRQVGG